MTRYCPAGDGAFADWIERCPECGRPLRDHPPAEADASTGASPDPIVWLTTAPNEPIAQMWVEDLRGEAIPVMVQTGGPGVGAWGSAAMLEHHLFVRAGDLARARALLAELNAADELGDADDDEAPPSPL